jgi:electron transfer flavoprotein alpha subunit
MIMGQNPKEFSGVWILGEQGRDGHVLPITHELLTRGLELAGKRRVSLTALILGNAFPEADLQELISRGADRVLVMEHPILATFLCEPYAACIAEVVGREKPEILIAGATSTGRTVMPYLAIRINTGLTADCTVLDIDSATGELLQTRPAIGGNIMATIRTPRHRPQMATVRPRSTKAAPVQTGRSGEIVRFPIPLGCLKSRVRKLADKLQQEEMGLAEADVVVCVGRGIKKAENLPLAERLAAALGGVVGATRDVVDRGWMEYPAQIGLSGKTITPRLYVGLGASGTIQHLAGMQTAETIVAVNRDPEAQIFRVADFGIVGDLFEVVPVLMDELKKRKGGAR